jgi:hypothetical protein
MISYLHQSWKQQWDRVCRLLKRVDGPEKGSSDEYDDDLICFFMQCWHLKEWIKHDNNLSSTIRDKVEAEIGKGDEYPNLAICADVANRSKHLKFDRRHPPRVDPFLTNRDVTIPLGAGPDTCEHTITCADGSKHNAKEVARRAVQEWESFLRANGLI